LQHKGHDVVKAGPQDTVQSVVRAMSERRIGAVVVESPLMRPVGIFSEREFVNAVAEHGVKAFQCQWRA
jgi:CBS domain-containing protein